MCGRCTALGHDPTSKRQKMEHGAGSQKDSEDEEAEKRVDGDGSRSSMFREEVLHHFGRVEGFVAGRGDRNDGLAHLQGLRDLYPTGT